MATRIRRAIAKDEQFYFDVRTDPEVASMSESPPPTRTQHAIWYARQGAFPRVGPSKTAYLYIIEGLDVETWGPVGTLRLDLVTASDPIRADPLKTTAWVSVALQAAARRHGHGQAALHWVEEEARALGALDLCAWVKPENVASRRCFDRAGYRFVGRREPGGMLLAIRAVPRPRPRWTSAVVTGGP